MTLSPALIKELLEPQRIFMMKRLLVLAARPGVTLKNFQRKDYLRECFIVQKAVVVRDRLQEKFDELAASFAEPS